MRRSITRRKLIQGTALAAGAAVFGPWKFNRVYAASSDKPIRIGLTHDASGQFANSGQAEKRGTILAIEEANDSAIMGYYQKNFGGKENIDDVINMMSAKQSSIEGSVKAAETAVGRESARLGKVEPQETGKIIQGAIETPKAQAKTAIGTLEANIPDYPMTFKNLTGEVKKAIANKKLSAGQRKIVESFQQKFQSIVSNGRSTHTALGLNRTLNEEISRAMSKPETEAQAAILLQIKDGLAADLATVGKLARTGKIKVYGGKTVEPDVLAKELETRLQDVAVKEAKMTPDINKMVSEIGAKSDVPIMRVVGESDKSYFQRISSEYRKTIGKEIPTMAKLPQLL